MRIKIVSSRRVFDARAGPKFKLSAESVMLLSEVTEKPSFTEKDIAELIEGVTDRVTLKFIESRIERGDGDGAKSQALFEKLGFRGSRLTAEETKNLKILPGKYIRPKMVKLESDKTELTKRIASLGEIIEPTKSPEEITLTEKL